MSKISLNELAELLAASRTKVDLGAILTPTGQLADMLRGSPASRRMEQLAQGARGGFDNSKLTERGIRGIFYDALENSFDNTWASRVGLLIPSDTEVETHRWLGQTPGMREWVGGLLANGMLDFEVQIRNKDFEATIAISTHDLRRDKTGHIVRRVGELAQRANSHWEELSVALLESNPTAYDGVSYFATTHSIGDSGTLDNALVAGTLSDLNVVDPTKPTKAEGAAILAGATAHFFTFKDDKGKKANQGARDFLLLCPPKMAPGFIQAVKDQLYVQGGSNELANLGWSYSVVAEPELSSTSVAYLFRTDGPSSKPLILQSEVDPMLDVIGEGSEHAKLHNEHLYSVKACRNVGPGEWRHAIKLTLS